MGEEYNNMKVLILSCNTGEGHNSCAKALETAFAGHQIFCETTDALEFISPSISDLMAKGHVFMYRHLPGVFDWGYHFTDRHPYFYRKGSPMYAFLSMGAEKLAEYVNRCDYDAVICAHVFSGVMMTEAMPYCEKKPVTAFLTTDYTCSPITEVSDLDMYFTPDERMQRMFTDKSIPAEKLIPLGIPIREPFYHKGAKAEAKAAEGIAENHRHLLVMCGSMGCGPIKKIVKNIAGRLTDNTEMTVVCGRNKKLQEELSELSQNSRQIHVRGYVQEISHLMDSADVYLTKPGGISVTEAGAKQLPMVLVNAVGGCEQNNFDFFTGIGAAVSGETVEEIIEECLALLEDQTRQEQMQDIYMETIPNDAAEQIARYLTEYTIQREVHSCTI